MRILVFLSILIPVLGISQNVANWNLPVVTEPIFKKDTTNIVKFGALNDGITLNTKSINEAITDCNLKGGGVVLVPNGLWLHLYF